MTYWLGPSGACADWTKRPLIYGSICDTEMVLVVQTGTSSNYSSQVRCLAAELPELLGRAAQVVQRTPRERRAQRRLSPEEVAALVGDYLAGATVKELALGWGVHRGTVTNHLARAGIEMRSRGLTSEQIEQSIHWYGQGWSIRQVAGRHGWDYETVRQALLRAGVELRPKTGG